MIRLAIVLTLFLAACGPASESATATLITGTTQFSQTPSPTRSPTPTSTVHPFACPEDPDTSAEELVLQPFETPTRDLNIFYWRIVEQVSLTQLEEGCGSDCMLNEFKEGDGGEGIPQFELSLTLAKWDSEAEAREFASTSWEAFASQAANLEEFKISSWLPEGTAAGMKGANELVTYLTTFNGEFSIEIEHRRPTPHEFVVDSGSVQHLAALQIAKISACSSN